MIFDKNTDAQRILSSHRKGRCDSRRTGRSKQELECDRAPSKTRTDRNPIAWFAPWSVSFYRCILIDVGMWTVRRSIARVSLLTVEHIVEMSESFSLMAFSNSARPTRYSLSPACTRSMSSPAGSAEVTASRLMMHRSVPSALWNG